MIKKSIIISGILSIFMITGCSMAPQKMEPLTSNYTRTMYNDGTEIAINKIGNNIVLIRPNNYKDDVGRTVRLTEAVPINVLVSNGSDHPFDVIPEQITAQMISPDKKHVINLKVWSQDELIAKERRERIAMAIFGIAAGAVVANQAANNMNTQFGKQVVIASTAATTATAIHLSNIDSYNRLFEQNSNRLKRTTLFPGKTYGGLIFVDTPIKAFETHSTIIINIPIDGNIHKIEFLCKLLGTEKKEWSNSE